jgi:hypothetical protein
MTEVLHANIFFFITSIAVIAFTILFSIALYHLIKIIRTIRRILDRIEAGSTAIAADLAHLRSYWSEGSLLSRVLRGVLGGSDRGSRPRPRSPREKAGERDRTELAVREEHE